MQPLELTISGLTSFGQRVTIDFREASLFALVGPTGAGKSSIVDAITLALYGLIPRLQKSEIAPAISMSSNECLVSLDFTVRGAPFRATRVIRRNKNGASTVEASLEQLTAEGDVVTTLAGNADEVSQHVESLIGLSFDEFTRAVVLPQGEFARLLKAKPGDRQALLARLLDTEVYERIKVRAGVHARSAQDRAEQTAHQIAQLGAVNAEGLESLATRATTLQALVDQLRKDHEGLEQVRERFRVAQAAATAARERVTRLQGITAPPDDVCELGDRIGQADRAIEKAQAALEAANGEVLKAEQGLASQSQLDALRAAVAAHERTPELEQAAAAAATALAQLGEHRSQVEKALAKARTHEQQARAAQVAVHREHAALQAVHGLAAGDGCPVCAATLTDKAPALLLDPDEGDAALRQAGDALAAAMKELGGLETQLTRAGTDLEGAQRAVAVAQEKLAGHLAALEGQPRAADAQLALDEAAQRSTQLAGLRSEARRASDDLGKATAERRRLEQHAGGLKDRLDRLRLAVASENPPSLTGDLVADWTSLHDWSRERLDGALEDAESAEAGVESVRVEGAALRQAMDSACEAAGLPADGDDPLHRAIQAHAGVTAEHAHMTGLLELVTSLRAEEEDAREQALVGAELARLLRSDQFQRWLLDEASVALVAGASEQLRLLSSGRYELSLDKRGAIEVCDLASAGKTRSVRTLSGGETFLASLALALSLADQIAMSATGQVALESLFIDEGFGALDPETLDIATSAIEQLGAGDRTVGVITHVAEMAERMPTRFVVTAAQQGSRVERVEG